MSWTNLGRGRENAYWSPPKDKPEPKPASVAKKIPSTKIHYIDGRGTKSIRIEPSYKLVGDDVKMILRRKSNLYEEYLNFKTGAWVKDEPTEECIFEEGFYSLRHKLLQLEDAPPKNLRAGSSQPLLNLMKCYQKLMDPFSPSFTEMITVLVCAIAAVIWVILL